MAERRIEHKEFIEFIKWKDDFNTIVELINQQHLNVLQFLNRWYNEIRDGKLSDDVAGLMGEKFEYLNEFSLGHLRFESGMLKILTEKYGYPRDEYQEHVEVHRRFVRELMIPLSKEIKLLAGSDEMSVLESISKESLRDVGKWWYQHIKSPKEDEPPGPDHKYRLFIDKLSPDQKIALLNDIILLQEQQRRKAG